MAKEQYMYKYLAALMSGQFYKMSLKHFAFFQIPDTQRRKSCCLLRKYLICIQSIISRVGRPPIFEPEKIHLQYGMSIARIFRSSTEQMQALWSKSILQTDFFFFSRSNALFQITDSTTCYYDWFHQDWLNTVNMKCSQVQTFLNRPILTRGQKGHATYVPNYEACSI